MRPGGVGILVALCNIGWTCMKKSRFCFCSAVAGDLHEEQVTYSATYLVRVRVRVGVRVRVRVRVSESRPQRCTPRSIAGAPSDTKARTRLRLSLGTWLGLG